MHGMGKETTRGVRFDPDVLEQLQKRAKDEDRSMNWLVNLYVRQALGSEEGVERLRIAPSADEFGPKLRQTFLDRKIDVKVKVEGSSAERLVLSFALFDDVWVNDFKKGELCGEILGLGFKSIDFTDGYNYAVRLPL